MVHLSNSLGLAFSILATELLRIYPYDPCPRSFSPVFNLFCNLADRLNADKGLRLKVIDDGTTIDTPVDPGSLCTHMRRPLSLQSLLLSLLSAVVLDVGHVQAAEPKPAPLPGTESGEKAPPQPASQPAQPVDNATKTKTSIALLTMDLGDHLWNRFGHSAILVVKKDPNKKLAWTRVYNWGDADFQDPWFAYHFLRGDAQFRLSIVGTLSQTVTQYARANRTVYHQQLNLTDDQVAMVVKELNDNYKPSKRYYRYHHREQSCGTKVRDVLDKAVGSAIRDQLAAVRDPDTDRGYGRQGFAGHIAAEIFNDLFMGRLHDQPMNKFYAMHLPMQMMASLPDVMVPNPTGAPGKVPLATAPKPLFTRQGPPATAGKGRTLIHLSTIYLGFMLVFGVIAYFSQPTHPRRAGLWLMVWALPMGLTAIIMAIGFSASTVAEGRYNELMLAFPPTDILLVGVAWRWLRKRAHAGRWLRIYAKARLGMVLLSLAFHGLGIFYQEPRILVFVALVCTLGLLALSHRFPKLPLESRPSRV